MGNSAGLIQHLPALQTLLADALSPPMSHLQTASAVPPNLPLLTSLLGSLNTGQPPVGIAGLLGGSSVPEALPTASAVSNPVDLCLKTSLVSDNSPSGVADPPAFDAALVQVIKTYIDDKLAQQEASLQNLIRQNHAEVNQKLDLIIGQLSQQ
ncbi:hypothetical protein H4R33_001233 [Dimargaris cristalligena]|nr:hypothetical protein H4R33_001233 [Dimargaris cristalligena]